MLISNVLTKPSRHPLSNAPRWGIAALAAAVVVSATPDLLAQQLRFSATVPGGIRATGNTLGLSKAYNENGPGLQDSIGTFITLDSISVDDSPLNGLNPWASGTTFDWSLNGSSAVLTLPPASDVLYAELVWAGSYDYLDNVNAYLDDPVSLSFGNVITSVTPSNATALTIAEMSYQNFAANYYLRSADVTTFVQQHGTGRYAVEGVPATQTTTINSLNAAGWTLMVAFRGEDQPIRNLSVFVGGSFVDEDSQQDYGVNGFCAPPFGPVEGQVVVSALEGDADLVGDDLSIAPTDTSPFVGLSGPNNPGNNFFCSQINDDNGLVDTQGSFGNANHDAFNGNNISGGRQGWDVTTVQISSMDGHLSNGQKSAVVRTNTTGDSFVPVAVAIELDVKSPDFRNSSTTADKDPVIVGDDVNVTIVLTNDGEALADNLLLVLPVESGLQLTGFSTNGSSGDINGNPVSAQDLLSGVDVGQLAVGATLEVIASFEVVGAPSNGNQFLFTPVFEHAFVVCDGDPAISGSHGPPPAVVSFTGDAGQGGNGAGAGGNTSSGAGGSSSSGGVTTSGGNGDSDDIGEDGNCGCTTVGRKAPSGAWALLALVFGIALRRRRR